MRELSTDLAAHYATRQTTLCWCWRVELASGDVMGFTNHDRNVTFDSLTYQADTGVMGTELEQKFGMSTDEMSIEGALTSEGILESDIRGGLYDEALVSVYEVNWADPDQRILLKTGRVSKITRGPTAFIAEVSSLGEEMNASRGKIISYLCTANLGDSACGVDLSTVTNRGLGTVTYTNGTYVLETTDLAGFEENFFSHGVLTFLSGNNESLSGWVRTHSKSTNSVRLELWGTAGFTIEVGDSFEVKAGCDRLFKTCKAKFNNGLRFRGFPHVPGTSFLMYVGNKGGKKQDGEPLFNGRD